MSGKYTVTIHVDEFESLVGGVGHAFVTITSPDGSSITRGYYPGNGAAFDAPEYNDVNDDDVVEIKLDGGVVKDDAITGKLNSSRQPTEHDYDYSQTYEVSEDQYDAMMDHVSAVERNPNNFYHVKEVNCTSFVKDVLEAGGIDHPGGGNPHPDSLIPGWDRAHDLGLDTTGTDSGRVGSEGFISEDMENGLDAVNAGFGFYNALENGSTVRKNQNRKNQDTQQSV